MARRPWLPFLLLFALCPRAFCEQAFVLSAGSVRSWEEGTARAYVLEGAPSIASAGGSLSGDAIVAWFDAAAAPGKAQLRVYSESGGAGALTLLTGATTVSVDSAAFTALDAPEDSALVRRARIAATNADAPAPDTAAAQPQSALAQAETAQAPPAPPTTEPGTSTDSAVMPPEAEAEAAPGEAIPKAEPAEAPPAPLAEPVTSTDSAGFPPEAEPVTLTNETIPEGEPVEWAPSAPAAPEPSTDALVLPRSILPPEGISKDIRGEITYSPIDADKYDMESALSDGATQVVITGGIEIGFAGYRMRAGNMVIRTVETAEGRVAEIEVYAEENVRFFTPTATLEADRLFYSSADDGAIMLDVELHAMLTAEGLPLVLRAQKVRSYAGVLYRAENAYVTTCEFGKPHYRVSAATASVIPIKHPDGTDSAIVTSKDNRFIVQDTTLLRVPRVSRDIRTTFLPLRRFQADKSNRFGYYAYTTWGLWDLMGGASSESWVARASTWSELFLNLDWREYRGTAGGIDFQYDREGTRGDLQTYYIRDRGDDANGFAPPSDDRGRAKWEQRTFIGDYQVDTELYYISDRGFLDEYYPRESKEHKEPETYVYVKRAWEQAQADVLMRPRVNDFQTQVEYLPQARLDVSGQPFLDGRIVYSSTSAAGNVRFMPDEALVARSYQTQRLDTKHIFDVPFALPYAMTVTPFGTVRGTYWNDAAGGDAAERFAGSWGAKVNLPTLWRVYEVNSDLLNSNRLRHVVNLDFTYEDVYDSTRRPSELLPFDDVETVTRARVATLALRQRLQTKREGALAEDPPRTVNLLQVDAEADFYPDADDNGGMAWSDIRTNTRSAITDDVSVVTDSDYDTYSENFRKTGIWVKVDHSPRTSLALGNRYIRTVSSGVVTASMEHQITDRWDIGALSQFDYDHGQMLDARLVLRRKMHDVAVEFKVNYDKGREETDVGVNFYLLTGAGMKRF